MGGGGGDSGGTNVNIVRYASYVENHHEDFLDESRSYGNILRPIASSPYADYVQLDNDDAIYGIGYAMSSFPSLYDMFGKFMAGVDIESLFEQVLSDVQNTETIRNVSDAHRDLLTDDIEQDILPRFRAGMRDINSVMSSTFIMGESVIEQGRLKKLADFDAKLQYSLVPVAVDLFGKHLSWNHQVVSTYLDIIKSAATVKFDEVAINCEIVAKDKLWPFTVLAQERANLGALQGARTETTSDATGGPSTASKVIGGAMSGAAAGSMISPGWGTAIGAVVGGIAGLL